MTHRTLRTDLRAARCPLRSRDNAADRERTKCRGEAVMRQRRVLALSSGLARQRRRLERSAKVRRRPRPQVPVVATLPRGTVVDVQRLQRALVPRSMRATWPGSCGSHAARGGEQPPRSWASPPVRSLLRRFDHPGFDYTRLSPIEPGVAVAPIATHWRHGPIGGRDGRSVRPADAGWAGNPSAISGRSSRRHQAQGRVRRGRTTRRLRRRSTRRLPIGGRRVASEAERPRLRRPARPRRRRHGRRAPAGGAIGGGGTSQRYRRHGEYRLRPLHASTAGRRRAIAKLATRRSRRTRARRSCRRASSDRRGRNRPRGRIRGINRVTSGSAFNRERKSPSPRHTFMAFLCTRR